MNSKYQHCPYLMCDLVRDHYPSLVWPMGRNSASFQQSRVRREGNIDSKIVYKNHEIDTRLCQLCIFTSCQYLHFIYFTLSVKVCSVDILQYPLYIQFYCKVTKKTVVNHNNVWLNVHVADVSSKRRRITIPRIMQILGLVDIPLWSLFILVVTVSFIMYVY